jgi:hypothetical protein
MPFRNPPKDQYERRLMVGQGMTIHRAVPNINTGKPWSKMDDDDLKTYFVKGETVLHKAVARAADFLCRNQAEVRARPS